MRLVKVHGEVVKASERQLLTLLDRDRFPTEGFLRLLLKKTFEVGQRPARKDVDRE